MGFIVIPESKNIEHIRENFYIFDFNLCHEDMNEIEKLNSNSRRYIRTEEALEKFLEWKIQYEE